MIPHAKALCVYLSHPINEPTSREYIGWCAICSHISGSFPHAMILPHANKFVDTSTCRDAVVWFHMPRSCSTNYSSQCLLPQEHSVSHGLTPLRASVTLRTSLRSRLTQYQPQVCYGLRDKHLPSGDCGLCCTLSGYFLTYRIPSVHLPAHSYTFNRL